MWAMKVLFQQGKHKSALSNLIGYVLLISITISLSVLIYGWLKFYVSEDDIKECPKGVSIIIKDYECFSGNNGNLTVILKNKGLFTVDGYVLRVHNRPGAKFGFYTFDDIGIEIKPGKEYNETYNFSEQTDKLDNITLVEIQPFIKEDNQINCKSHISQKIECR